MYVWTQKTTASGVLFLLPFDKAAAYCEFGMSKIASKMNYITFHDRASFIPFLTLTFYRTRAHQVQHQLRHPQIR